MVYAISHTNTYAAATNLQDSGFSIEAVAAMATLILVGFGLLFARKQMHASLMNDMSARWEQLMDARRAVSDYNGHPEKLLDDIKRFNAENSEEYYLLTKVPNFFEDLAIQIDERTIPLKMVAKSFGYALKFYWELWALATIEYLRVEGTGQMTPEETRYQEFEKLVERLKRREKRRKTMKRALSFLGASRRKRT